MSFVSSPDDLYLIDRSKNKMFIQFSGQMQQTTFRKDLFFSPKLDSKMVFCHDFDCKSTLLFA